MSYVKFDWEPDRAERARKYQEFKEDVIEQEVTVIVRWCRTRDAMVREMQALGANRRSLKVAKGFSKIYTTGTPVIVVPYVRDMLDWEATNAVGHEFCHAATGMLDRR